MSDTPRTDAFEALTERPINWWDFARKLERENAALRADKERLDWLEKARPIAWALGNSTRGEYWLLTDLGEGHPEEAEEFPTLREAIDAARKEEQS